MKVSGLEGPACWLSRKSAARWIAAAVVWLPLSSAEWVGWPGVQAPESLVWLGYILCGWCWLL